MRYNSHTIIVTLLLYKIHFFFSMFSVVKTITTCCCSFDEIKYIYTIIEEVYKVMFRAKAMWYSL